MRHGVGKGDALEVQGECLRPGETLFRRGKDTKASKETQFGPRETQFGPMETQFEHNVTWYGKWRRP